MRRPLLGKPYTGLRHLEDEYRRPGAVPREESSLPDPPRRRPWTTADDERILAGLAAGEMHKEIAAALGRTLTATSGHICYLRKTGRLGWL